MQNTAKSANNGHVLDEFEEVVIVDDVKAEDSIPVFPAMKEQAPPIPPPVAELPPPLPPPVDECLREETFQNADSPVQLPSRSSGSFNRKRRFPRRRVSLVAALLILCCFGLGSHDSKAPRSQSLETTQVTFSESASPALAQAGLGEPNTTTDYVVEEINNAPPLSTARAVEAVETEAVDFQFADDPTKTVEVPKADAPQPNRPLPEGKGPARLADHADELDAAPATEPETCELALDSKQLLGTAVWWAETANEAAMIADDQGKLVYLIQVSGNFEIPEFT